MKTIFYKFRFDNTFYLFLILIIIFGLFKYFTFLFILLFFHEIGHAIMGVIFKWEIVDITFYPYGGKTTFNVLENRNLIQELFILLNGPIFQIITYLILMNIFNYDYIKTYHYTLLFFNLLPIYTLDGGKLFNIICNFLFSYLRSFKLTIIISIIFIIILFIFSLLFYKNLNLLLISIFLFIQVLKSIKNLKYYYHKFLLERYLYKIKYNKVRYIKNIKDFYINSYHFVNYLSERQFLNNLFSYNNEKCLTKIKK